MKSVQWDRFRQVMDRFRGTEVAVLVVDDDANTHHHIRSVLEREGWHVVEATNRKDALDRVAEGVPSVVLLDLEMPEMDGFGFLQALRTLPDCSGTPVVVLTAEDLTREDRRRLHGASEALSKGVTSLFSLSRELRSALSASNGKAEQ